jgi:hypothetical protein
MYRPSGLASHPTPKQTSQFLIQLFYVDLLRSRNLQWIEGIIKYRATGVVAVLSHRDASYRYMSPRTGQNKKTSPTAGWFLNRVLNPGDRLCGLAVRVPGYRTEMCFLWGMNWIYICYVEKSRPPLWSSGQSSWLQNGDLLCFLWGTNWIYMLCRRK